MYGTIFRMKVKPGHGQRVIDIFNDWERDRKPKTKGAIGGFLFRPEVEPSELIGVAIFQDKESYVANADIHEQDTWYRLLREQLESDPVWEDGEYVAGQLD